MSDQLLSFSNLEPSRGPQGSSKGFDMPMAKQNPYDVSTSPKDIMELLPPDSTMFGMYSDPYASMVYIDPSRGNHNGRYWLNQRIETHSFTENEIALLNILSTQRVVTRNQVHRILFNVNDRPEKPRDFLKKCRQRGIICAFSWISPLKDGKKKPLVYGLTNIGAAAVEHLFHRHVPKDFIFQPIQFNRVQGPSMTTFFLDLVANEFFSELKRIDRLISWERRKTIRLTDGTIHHTGAAFEVIKDRGQHINFWLEVVRIGPNWVEKLIQRFERIQLAYEKTGNYDKPARLFLIVDSDARIPYVAKLAELYMKDVNVRFTTDERLLKGLDNDTFITWNNEANKLVVSKMGLFLPTHNGMKASEYFKEQEVIIEDEDDLFDE